MLAKFKSEIGRVTEVLRAGQFASKRAKGRLTWGEERRSVRRIQARWWRSLDSYASLRAVLAFHRSNGCGVLCDHSDVVAATFVTSVSDLPTDMLDSAREHCCSCEGASC